MATLVRNRSERFEARFSLVKVTDSPSLLLQGMAGSQMPIAVSHGEGFAEFRDAAQLAQLEAKNLVGLRFVDHYGQPTEQYPLNPNGSVKDHRCYHNRWRSTIMMPHLSAF